jgi:aspartyl/asparaginyl beta-hydroxylase (cupin superfamily)
MNFDVNELLNDLKNIAPARELERVEECLLRLAGHRPIPDASHALQQPTRLHYPGLEARAWHHTERFDWVPRLESHFEAILAEVTRLLGSDARFMPYEDPYTLELGWSGWETFTLYRKGRFDLANCARAKQTAAVLKSVAHGVRQGMFTKLAPKAHITPHSGGANVLLTCHLGLVIPEDCAIRVGDETRTWVPGKVLIFDDSFIHEAWNRSDWTRVVLLWDIWHPDLTEVEIRALTHLFPKFDRIMRGVD